MPNLFNLVKNIRYINIMNEFEYLIERKIKDIFFKDENLLEYTCSSYTEFTNISYLIKNLIYSCIYKNYKQYPSSNIDYLNNIKAFVINLYNLTPTELYPLTNSIAIGTTNIISSIIKYKVYNIDKQYLIDEFQKSIVGIILLIKPQILESVEDQSEFDIQEYRKIYDNCEYFGNMVDNVVSKNIHILINNILATLDMTNANGPVEHRILGDIYEEINLTRNPILQKYYYLYDTEIYMFNYTNEIFYLSAISIIQYIKYKIENRLYYLDSNFNVNKMNELKNASVDFIKDFQTVFCDFRNTLLNECDEV